MKHYFGKTVRRFRSKFNMTQWELSERLGHNSGQYVSNLERGTTFASIEMALKLAKILDIPKSVIMADFKREYEIVLIKGFK